ncbi:MAG TPA: NADH-ubiquinone oxidoreductase-F iron-sulfur binding region domain-containing protein [Flavobacteriales bacterium]|nr:NADH-ubiquinone oxidoreductase-F iron-sulfur binding region domain-containing protein [Flavobacteriales bacterium]HMR28232.1 NADH-ubiquinone oxidoreductase-F iron-sulfur binding region domain-containing protein [Flavobacteriales bacterium]
MSKNITSLSGRDGKELDDALWDRLQAAADHPGTPSTDALTRIADEYLIGEAVTYGTSTFYDFLKPENKGVKAYVCTGSACLVAGTQDKVHHALRKHFTEEEIGHMCCLGRCHENSAFHIGGRNYSGDSVDRVDEVAKAVREGRAHSVVANGGHHVGTTMEAPILTAPMPPLPEFYAVWERVLRSDPADILQEIKVATIRGRGGAGFPMGFKLEACRNATDTTGNGTPRKYIVCNADEGDPAAFSDRYLLEQRPHRVLLGMMIAGYCVGADTGVLYIRAEYPEAIAAVKEAIQELEAAGWIGTAIKGGGFHWRFKVIKAAGAYVCGEETALLNSIEGKRGEVRTRPPYPAQQGLFNRPTVVNNVETLACVPWVVEHGGAAFARLGTEKSNGSKLVCLDSGFNRPGLYEVECGTPLARVIDELGQGFARPTKALHIGGPLGGIVPMEKINALSIDFESFQKEGFLLGHASVLSIPADFPMLDYLEHLFAFTAAESCGKCFPCRIGSTRGRELIHGVREGRRIDRALFQDLIETMEIGSLCALGGGLPLGVRNALHYFGDELRPAFT